MSLDEASKTEITPEIHDQIQTPPSRNQRLAFWLFLLGLAVYLLTRLINLPDFPIYFFTDEAIQAQHAVDLAQHGFKDHQGIFLPTYFENGGQYNLSLSVYAQVLPTLILEKTVWVTRGVSVLISLTAALALGLTLRDAFNSRYWWLGTLLLAISPGWFLHSRTAFETIIMASMYAGFLYFYLRYRQGHPKSLFFALLFGALSFYAYSPGQVIIVFTGVLLLFADIRYHWQNRKTALLGLGLLIILALPYLRFSLNQGQETIHHLTVLNSYWVKPIPFQEKILTYLSRYAKGFNPVYWFWPNPPIIKTLLPQITLPTWLFSNLHDLDRHTMKGYGHLLLFTFPFWVIGLVICVKKFKNPPHRTILLATLAAPSGAAIVDWGITRGMVFIIPTTLITALGIEAGFNWLQTKWKKIRYPHIAVAVFLALTLLTFGMLFDSLINGPTWYEDYGLSGLQYGGRQIFTRSAEIAKSDPNTTVLVSSTWANGPNVVMRYFTNDLPNVRIGNINAYGYQYKPLDRSYLFVMTGEDLLWLSETGKFQNITIEETILYPDGRIGFYFVRLEYVDNIEEILAAEKEARQALISEVVTIKDQPVTVQYPILDMNEIVHAFDGDPTTLIRTFEANPLKLILNFSEPINVSSIAVIIGGTPTEITVSALYKEEQLDTLAKKVESSTVNREVTLEFDQTLTIDVLKIEILNPHDNEIAHIHLWEVTIK